MQNPIANPEPAEYQPTPPGSQGDALQQVATELQAVQQQALATQRGLDQLQSEQPPPSATHGWSDAAFAAGTWGVGLALLLVLALRLAHPWRKKAALADQGVRVDSMTSDLGDDPSAAMALHKPAQGSEISQWATEPESEADFVSDWGAIPLVRPDPATTFDLEAATTEVSRVRDTLAQRRKQRALEREHDAQLLREAAQRAENAALTAKLQAMPHISAWVPDLDLSLDAPVRAAANVSAPPPAHAPAPTPISTSPITMQPVADPEATPEPELAPQDGFAIKLALAHESEAIDLFDEARELAEEVLAAPDPMLVGQAKELLAQIQQKLDAIALDNVAFDDGARHHNPGGR